MAVTGALAHARTLQAKSLEVKAKEDGQPRRVCGRHAGGSGRRRHGAKRSDQLGAFQQLRVALICVPGIPTTPAAAGVASQPPPCPVPAPAPNVLQLRTALGNASEDLPNRIASD